MAEFAEFGKWTAFGLALAETSLEAIESLGGKGTEVVEGRPPGYREFDPEVIGVDKKAEDTIIEGLRGSGAQVTVLSEEAGRIELPGDPAKAGDLTEPVYCIIDPFDGSMLYRRQIPAFWYTCLAIYDMGKQPLCSVVVDVLQRTVDFANQQGAYTATYSDGSLYAVKEVEPSDVTELSEAFFESYMMKPPYMYPTASKFEPLFQQGKFILPNGGPCGFADVAKGKVDVYVAVQEAAVEVFTGMPIAERAGAVVTTFDGRQVAFEEDLNKNFAVVCSANEQLHHQALAEIAKLGV
ncbi:MAG: inositol monophosphatase family protein [Armatimonadota bacterium]